MSFYNGLVEPGLQCVLGWPGRIYSLCVNFFYCVYVLWGAIKTILQHAHHALLQISSLKDACIGMNRPEYQELHKTLAAYMSD